MAPESKAQACNKLQGTMTINYDGGGYLALVSALQLPQLDSTYQPLPVGPVQHQHWQDDAGLSLSHVELRDGFVRQPVNQLFCYHVLVGTNLQLLLGLKRQPLRMLCNVPLALYLELLRPHKPKPMSALHTGRIPV